MACPGEGILTNLAKSLEDKTVKEFRYFLDFENHVQDFVIENNSLAVKRKKVENDVEDAKKRNENQIEGDVQNWIEEVDIVIQENTKIKQTWSYGWCPYWQYRQGKMLAKRTPAIRDLIHKCNFERVARLTELPGIKYHASCDFIHFESRTTKVNQLVEALKDGKQHMIGLQGMGGTGKTTLVTQVGKQLEESKAFERAIFIVVSNPPDVNKIRGEIARPLGLNLENWVEAEHSQQLWTRISKYEQKLLIILDDVWEELNLKNIGIPSGPDNKNCYVLITTRDLKVCDTMRCQQKVVLEILDDKDALNLFLSHARSSEYSSSNNLESFARDFVKECGGLPIAIVALASTLRNCDVGELNAALITLRKSKPFFNFDKNLEKVYKCLELSYLNLPKDEARKLFLLCSIFPEDYEIPINLIVRLGIGLGILEKVDEYCEARRQAHALKTILINSSLLLNVKEDDCVKMHDVVREVAQWIGKEYIQVIMNSRTTLKPNMQFVFWSAGDFPDQFDGTKLEVLLLWISVNVSVKNPNAFLMGMTELKILFLHGEYVRKLPSPSLLNSLLSLTYIQTLILEGWELGDISILENISSLVTLEFKNCLIIELPRNITKLEKLRWLGLRKCEIQRNNPFEVTKRCSQLEEFYFVGNYNVKDWNTEDDKEIEDEIAHDISPAELQIFSIAYDGFERFSNDDNGLLRCFNPKHIKHLIPDALFKYLVRSAEVLELGKIGQTRWKNLAPDIIPMENGGMDNLIKLYLYEWDDFECLVDNSKDPYSTTKFFSKMVELHLDGVGVKRLYQGAMPSSFLLQLQILKLEECMELQNIFFDENIKLPYLKVLKLIGCPMFQPSIFQRSIAQSLERLEELVIKDCEELKCLIAYEEMIHVGSQENYCLLFQKLKSLQIRGCGKLEMVFSLLLPGDFLELKDLYICDCRELKYIFGEYRDVGQVLRKEIILPLEAKVRLEYVPSFISIFENCQKCVLRPPQVLKEDSTVKQESSKTNAFSWAYGCCFSAPTKDTNIGIPHATEHHIISEGSSKGMETVDTAECLMRHPLILQNIKEMTLSDCSKLKSLFSVSIATTMILLESLYIERCEELKDIIRNEAEDDEHLNCTSIFPKLQSLHVEHCNKLEFIFPSTLSGGFHKLYHIYIRGAKELKHVFGRYDNEECISNENENNEPHIHLPALESLSLIDLPNIISIGIKKYQQKCPSLQIVEAPKEIKKHMQDVTSESAKESELQEIVNVETPLTPCVGFQYFLSLCNLKEIRIHRNQKLKTLFSISACRNLPQLSKLYITECEELVNVVVDDSTDHSSISPKLKHLFVRDCNKLEFIFPLSFFDSLQKLKYLSINEAAELKYIFGNESDDLHIHLPGTLKRLSFMGVPKIMNKLLAKKYHVSFLSLQSIELGDLQEFNIRSFLDLIAYLQKMQLNKKVPKDLIKIIKDVQKLTELTLRDSKIEEVLNLEGVEIEGILLTLSLEAMQLEDLCELRHICNGPKYILSLPNLRNLDIKACKNLRVIFNVSIVKSLPQLSWLNIEDCDELADILDESDEDHLHKICFPKLETISIKRCNSLKCLFSISTCGMFPKLWSLTINDCDELADIIEESDEDRLHQICFPKLETISIMRCNSLKCLFSISTCDELADIIEESDEDHLHQICFPKLETISITRCNSLKCLFSISTCGMFPKLWSLTINDCDELADIIKESDEDHLHQICFPKLERISITRCSSLKCLFSISTCGMFPELWLLTINDCDELADIIEESDEDHLHQICFPKLERISITRCNSLKCLFSISTCGMFPKLWSLTINEASELDQVFTRKQDDMQKMIKWEEIFPKLSHVALRKLPLLITICEGIDFRTLRCEVHECPKYQGTNHIQEGSKNGDSENLAATNALPDSTKSKEETVKEVDAKDPTPESEQQAPKYSMAEPQMRMTSLHKVGRGVPDVASRLAATATATTTTSSASQELEDEHKTIESTTQFQHEDLTETKTTTEASHKINIPLDNYSIDVILKERSEQGPTLEEVAVADLKTRNSSNVTSSFDSQAGGLQSDPSTLAYKETEEEVGKAIPASSLLATTSPDFEVIVRQLRIEQNLSCIEDIPKDITSTQVASMKEKHDEQGSKGDDATRKSPIAIQSTDSESMKQPRSLEEIEREVARRHASQLPIAPTSTNLKITQSIKDTMEQGLKQNSPEDDTMIAVGSTNANSRKQYTIGPIDNLPRKDSTMSAKEKAKGVYEKATTTDTAPVATPFQSEFIRELPVKETGDHSSVHKEAELENPIKAVLPQVVPSLHHQSYIANASITSSPKLGICKIFRLVELKHGETTTLLAQALEQYPQLLLPCEHRTHRIIALSYRVLVDILVVLATKTPNTITPSEKSTLEANLSEAIVLGFDKVWVESVRAKVFGFDMSHVSKAKEEIQVMEVKLGDIDSQLLGLSEDRKKLIENMTMFRDMISAKDKPFGI